jgi:hypothetical protein
MQHQQHDYDHDDLADIWRSAQHRRNEDTYSWFTLFLRGNKSPTHPIPDSIYPMSSSCIDMETS